MFSICNAYVWHVLTNKPFNHHDIFSFASCRRSFAIWCCGCIWLVYTLHIQCIWFVRSLKVNYGYQCAFCMGRSVVPPTFCRRSIGNHAQLSPTPIGNHVQLSPTPIGNHVQLFRTHAQLYPAIPHNHDYLAISKRTGHYRQL